MASASRKKFLFGINHLSLCKNLQSITHFGRIFLMLLFAFLLPTAAFAFGGDTPVSDGLKYITNAMLGTTGITIATISIIAVGIMCKLGVFEWKRFVQVIVGIGVVFGAPAIVSGVVSLIHS